MSSQETLPTLDRSDLINALVRAIYENSTVTVFFHHAIADRVGIGATEEKTMLMLSEGPKSAGEIAQETGLTTASVTNLIDRLEHKGFVRRIRDTQDRRRVMVEADAERLAEMMQVFGSVGEIFYTLMDSYSDEQLATIIDFTQRSSAMSREAIAAMTKKPE